eukprot:SAG11_NODE_1306_length_5245_cov_6.023513_4_plen_48_part_00
MLVRLTMRMAAIRELLSPSTVRSCSFGPKVDHGTCDSLAMTEANRHL